MKESRIPYSMPMARARRAGLKTQTRRIFKLPRGHFWDEAQGGMGSGNIESDKWPGWWHISEFRCPFGQPGDILLPIEPWRAPAEFDSLPPSQIPTGTPIWLDANGQAPAGFGRYRHARFMPKHLIVARDELVANHVERLHDISEGDAREEGWPHHLPSDPRGYTSPCQWYAELWQQINGPGSWGTNPWVWVLEFKVLVP